MSRRERLRSDADSTPVLDVRGILAALAVSLVSLAFVGAGVAWPHAAGSLLRLLIVTLAVLYAAERASVALEHIGTNRKRYSPFDGGADTHRPPTAPQSLRSLTAQFGAADREEEAARVLIPWSTLATLLGEAQRRLGEHHGLDPGNPAHRPRIRSLVSGPTLQLLDVVDVTHASGSDVGLTMSQLPQILDDVERL